METNVPAVNQSTEEWINGEIREAMAKMLPAASSEQYERTYKKYQAWREEKGLRGATNEKEVFAFLHHKLMTKEWESPGTLWSRFSMIRSMILAREGIDIKGTGINTTIQTWLKRVGANHTFKQAHIFTKEQTRKFIREASETSIVQKLVLLVGVYTGLRCDTLTRLEWRHVRLNRDQVSILIDYDSKTDQGATGMWFAMPGATDDPKLDPYLLFCKYKQIVERKDKKLTEGRLWLRIDEKKDGSYKLTSQVRGIEWISSVPKQAAKWLGLPETEKYTGHSMRRTCAQWATDSGMTETQMQHHFGWKSAAMVVRYARSSDNLKQAMAKCLNMEEHGNEEERAKQVESTRHQKKNWQSDVRNIAKDEENTGGSKRAATCIDIIENSDSQKEKREKRRENESQKQKEKICGLVEKEKENESTDAHTNLAEKVSIHAEGVSIREKSRMASGEVASPPPPPRQQAYPEPWPVSFPVATFHMRIFRLTFRTTHQNEIFQRVSMQK